MDKNTLIGFVLILLIIVGFSWLNKPSKEDLEAARQQQLVSDSLARVEAARQQALLLSDTLAQASAPAAADTNSLAMTYGMFAPLAIIDSASYSTLENELVKLTFSNKGGRMVSAQLKQFMAGDSSDLILFDEEASGFNLSFFSVDSRLINTADLRFTQLTGQEPGRLTYRLAFSESAWLDFIYTLKEGDYRLKFDIKGQNLTQLMLANTNKLDLTWNVKMRQQEIGRKFEERYSGLNYKYLVDDVEKLSETKETTKSIVEDLKWVSFKDQFFACIAISDKSFSSNELYSSPEPENSPYIKRFSMTSSLGLDIRGDQSTGMSFYMGPIKHALLKSFDKGVPAEQQLDLDRIVPLGGKIIRWANTGIILPMFNLFGRFISNYGLIILLMTFVIKLLLFPLTYKSYMSSAKMRVLQPQITEINNRYPGTEKATERSQATMELYRKAGVSPMGGCLPMLLQMPILFAMYSFFPSSIELRQESFLWAHDLSTYDAIISWSGNVPLVTKYFGNHISLFCLLMTITNILYTHLNMKTQPTNNQMPGMKTMMYIMPVMFLFIFNQYSSGLSFYFFVSTLISILQTYAIRATVNEEKLLAQLNENKKKPVKKSGFAARLEQMQKEQQQMLREQQKKGKR